MGVELSWASWLAMANDYLRKLSLCSSLSHANDNVMVPSIIPSRVIFEHLHGSLCVCVLNKSVFLQPSSACLPFLLAVRKTPCSCLVRQAVQAVHVL